MAQNFTDDSYDQDHLVDTDMGNQENNDLTLKSSHSGSSSPSNPVAGMLWFFTTNDILKLRNNTGTAWYGLMHGDASQKIWVYRNSAMNGWVVDSSITDKLLGVKGGSTFVTGGTTAGTWSISGISHSHTVNSHSHTHNHQWYNRQETNDDDRSFDVNGSGKDFDAGSKSGAGYHGIPDAWNFANYWIGSDFYTNNDSTTASPGTDSQGSGDGNWRPAAAVGTLQYLDL